MVTVQSFNINDKVINTNTKKKGIIINIIYDQFAIIYNVLYDDNSYAFEYENDIQLFQKKLFPI